MFAGTEVTIREFDIKAYVPLCSATGQEIISVRQPDFESWREKKHQPASVRFSSS